MEQQTYPWILTEKRLTSLEVPSLWRSSTWIRLVKIAYYGIQALVALVFQGAMNILVALADKIVPEPIRPMIMFATLPFVFAIPLQFTFQVSEYYTEFRHYWLINGTSIQGSITILLLYVYRGHENLTTFIKLSMVWGFIPPIFMLLFQDNQAIFVNYEHALKIYTLLACIILSRDMFKYWTNRLND